MAVVKTEWGHKDRDYWLVTPNPVGFVDSSPDSTTSSAAGSSQARTFHKKSTPVGTIVGPVVGILALVALVAVIFLWRKRRHQCESPDDAPMSNVLNSSHSGFNSASTVDSGFNVSGAAGPPPALPRYSSELGPFATPHYAPSVVENGAGGSLHHEPDSYFATGTDSPEPTSTSYYPAASISGSSHLRATPDPSFSGPGHNTASPSISGSSRHLQTTIDSAEGIANAQPTLLTRILPSSKLLREAERARQWHVFSSSSSGSVPSSPGGGQESPPLYSE
ncbi:hypothetical protein B0H19DRAFT_1268426 [Mycena capillaripes]|nr:hypothetical protein B0H19DRAFT_1268426 [Mycena capillaripes]